MDRKACLEGQLLVREITHEYRMLLELLEDPQILVNGDPGEVDEVLKVVQQKQNLTSSPLSSIVTLSWKLAKLQECYNICLVNNHFEVKVWIIINIYSYIVGGCSLTMATKRKPLARYSSFLLGHFHGKGEIISNSI